MGYVLTPVHVPTVIKTNAVRAAGNKAILRMRITFLRLIAVETVIQESDAAGERGASSRALPQNGQGAEKREALLRAPYKEKGSAGFAPRGARNRAAAGGWGASGAAARLVR
jgi:hypothetical protein